jgi:Coenzyme PQQ synthesis protein D (PqqD)
MRSLRRISVAEKYIARSSAIAARMVGGEMMVMSAADSTFFTLNDVATAIWRAADGRTPLSEIVAGRICEEFEVDREQALRGADRFVDELSQHGILLVSDQPMDSSSSSSPSPESR